MLAITLKEKLKNKGSQMGHTNFFFFNLAEDSTQEDGPFPTAVSKREFVLQFQLILLNFVGAVIDQSYDLYMVTSLLILKQNTFAILFLMADIIPGVFTVLQKYFSSNKVWNHKMLLLACHPINMVVWPIKAAFNPTQFNLEQLEVLYFFIFTQSTTYLFKL